ncbi:NifB/NifX family molybdenum-iron cluster-binding protein [Clostridium sp. LBM24168]
MYKIAVASSDGKIIDQHFGQANQFYIYEVDDINYKFVELRKLENVPENFNSDYDKFLYMIRALSGCRIVVVSQIGQEAIKFLGKNGIHAFDIEEPIDYALKKLVEYYFKMDKINKYCN